MKPATQVLIERYQKHLYAIAFNICRNQQDAEDVVQDTFIQYHTYKKEFDTEEHIRAWLIRVAINKAKNITRSFWHFTDSRRIYGNINLRNTGIRNSV